MRFGLGSAVALALMGWAGQADAVTWVRYSITAMGYERSVDSSGVFNGPEAPREIYASFTVLIEPIGTFLGPGIGGPAGDTYTTDGSVFHATQPYTVFDANGAQSGRLTAQENFAAPAGAGSSGSINLTYADLDQSGGFPTAVASALASGSIGVQQFSMNRSQGRVISGSITRLTVSTAAGYERLSVTAVPEPASWAILIVGVGAIGAGVRRSRRVVAAA